MRISSVYITHNHAQDHKTRTRNTDTMDPPTDLESATTVLTLVSRETDETEHAVVQERVRTSGFHLGFSFLTSCTVVVCCFLAQWLSPHDLPLFLLLVGGLLLGVNLVVLCSFAHAWWGRGEGLRRSAQMKMRSPLWRFLVPLGCFVCPLVAVLVLGYAWARPVEMQCLLVQ